MRCSLLRTCLERSQSTLYLPGTLAKGCSLRSPSALRSLPGASGDVFYLAGLLAGAAYPGYRVAGAAYPGYVALRQLPSNYICILYTILYIYPRHGAAPAIPESPRGCSSWVILPPPACYCSAVVRISGLCRLYPGYLPAYRRAVWRFSCLSGLRQCYLVSFAALLACRVSIPVSGALNRHC